MADTETRAGRATALTDDDRDFLRRARSAADSAYFVGGCFGGGAWSRDFDPPTVQRLLDLVDLLDQDAPSDATGAGADHD